MIQLILVCVGKIKEPYLSDGIEEYRKRISKYAKIELIEIDDERIPDLPSEQEKLKTLEAEGKKIIAKIPKDAYLVTLEIEGTPMSSPELAAFIAKTGTYQNSKLAFVIGGSLGLSREVKKMAKTALSFSRMTLPHQLMRLVLLEQLYRSLSINANTAYHK